MVKTVTNRRLLIIEDDRALADTLREYFSRRDNYVALADSVENGIRAIENEHFDAIILDLMLPDGDGGEIFSACNDLPPVVILSVLSTEAVMLNSFSQGACDYVVKPCSPELLEARLVLRLLPKANSEITLHGITVNANTRTVTVGNEFVTMTSSEFNILWFLMSNAGRFFSTSSIYENIWGEPSLKQNSIKCHISHLRNKLLASTSKNLIVTEYGKGYKFLTE